MIWGHASVISGALSGLLILTACGLGSRLHRAIGRGDVTRVSQLLAHGGNPNNYVFDYGKPLSWATSQCNHDIVDLLLGYGASTTDYSAELSIRWAVQQCDVSTVRLLLEGGVDSNASYHLGPTVLTLGVERGDLDIITLLLDHEADPNRQGKHGPRAPPRESESYPLIIAAKRGRLDIVRLLVSRGADTAARGSSGLTALSVAIAGGHCEIENFLRDHGAI